MRKAILIALLSLTSMTGLFAQTKKPVVWSERVADNFINRYEHADAIRWGTQSNSFTWQAGYVMFAMEHLWRQTGNPAYLDYIRRYVDQNVDAEGRVRQFEPRALDNFIPGYACLLMYELTGEQRYATAAETIRRGFDNYPRTAEDMFLHSHSIRQVWVDGVFMGQIFLSRYAATMNHPEDFDEVARQIKGVIKLCGKDNGLLIHAWLSPEAGRSPEVWSEGLGWIAVLFADLFDYFPKDHPDYAFLLDSAKRLCNGLKSCTDPKTGMWCQVVDKPGHEGNWAETSGTGMFIYLIKSMIQKGYLPAEEYRETLEKAYEGILTKAVVNSDGFVNLIDCSSIGVKRSYQEYISQPREISTFAAYASFILGTGIMEHDMLRTIPGSFYATDYSGGNVLRFEGGRIAWKHEAPLSNDIQLLENGNLLFSTGEGVLEVDPQGREVFSYRSDCHVFACQRLSNGNTFVGECENARLLEIRPNGKIARIVKLLPSGMKADMSFMRNARKLDNGHYLVAHYGLEKVVEYDAKGREFWSVEAKGRPHSVIRLENGNTMIAIADANQDPRIIEVDPNGEIVWSLSNKDLPGEPLRFMSGMQYVEGQGLYITNWQGHRGRQTQPHAFLVTRRKRIVSALWPMDGIRTLSNIAVPVN